MYCNNRNIPATQTIGQLITHPSSNTQPVSCCSSVQTDRGRWLACLVVIMQNHHEQQLKKKRKILIANGLKEKGCTSQKQYKRNGFCNLHYDIWSRRQVIIMSLLLTQLQAVVEHNSLIMGLLV